MCVIGSLGGRQRILQSTCVQCPLAIRYLRAHTRRSEIYASKRSTSTALTRERRDDVIAAAETRYTAALIAIVRDMKRRGVDRIILPDGPKVATEISKEVSEACFAASRYSHQKLASSMSDGRPLPSNLQEYAVTLKRKFLPTMEQTRLKKQCRFQPSLDSIAEG